jgi:carbon monoxide dehydrogenase subunit G
MPITTTEFSVKLPQGKLWVLLNNLDALGKCVPGCEQVEVLGPDDSRWKVKLSVGIISRRIDAKVHVTERAEPERISLKLESVEGDITGAWLVQMSEEGQDSTRVKLVADLNARGSFEWIINQIIKTQMGKLVSQFAECISAKSSGTG